VTGKLDPVATCRWLADASAVGKAYRNDNRSRSLPISSKIESGQLVWQGTAMNWWQQLKRNGLARTGAIALILMYLTVIFAEFVAPYDQYVSQEDGSLLPPTAIHWTDTQGRFVGPHVYPTTQGPTDINTGDRLLKVDRTKPSPIQLFVRGDKYRLFPVSIPLLPKFDPAAPVKRSKTKSATTVKTKVDGQELTIFPGIPCDWHLFGTAGAGKLNLLGTDEQGRDQFSRLVYGGRISLFIGLIGVLISFPIGTILGGISGYFGGWIDAGIMRIAEVLMTLPSLYLLVALASVLPDRVSSSQRFLLIIIITSFISWAGLARVVRGQVLSIKEREYVQAARETLVHYPAPYHSPNGNLFNYFRNFSHP
jgi:peptide/nickel transport system permease protein